MVYEGLTRLSDTLETVPAAAEKWAYSADATQLTFTLRKGLKYSDGSLLNAKRFEYALLRNIDPATAGEYAGITDEILGAPEWRKADVSTASASDLTRLKEAVGVKALDASGNRCTGYDQADCTILQLTFSRPALYFHTVMSLWVTYPAKEELIVKGGEAWSTNPANQIGNGPMILTAMEPGSRMLFEPNPNYWRGRAGLNIEYRYVADSAAAFAAYKNNEFDIIPIASEDLSTIQADPDLNRQAQVYPGSCTFMVGFHHQKEPFNDAAVREAFSYAFDRESWVKDVLKGLGSPTQTWIPRGFPGYDVSEGRFTFDPQKARSTLTEAGYTVANGVLTREGKAFPITLTFPDMPRNRPRFEWLASKWKEILGIDVKLDPVELNTYIALSQDVKTAPQVSILGWCADYPDPQNWLTAYWKSGAMGKGIGYSNKELDVLLEKADIEANATRRADLYMQAQKLLVGSDPGIFAWNNVNAYLVKPNVKGLVQNPQDADWIGSNDPLRIRIEQ
jgi:oligopeptide transport system substrate-binding protein